MALARTVRQALISRWIETLDTQMRKGTRVVVYLSAEYLLGRQLDNALLATNLQATARHALASLDLDLDELRDLETEPGLGNGGLGRLAACFLDSWRRCRSLQSAMASATNTEFSPDLQRRGTTARGR